MKKSLLPTLLMAGGFLAVIQQVASAHPGHSGSGLAGILHPLTGVDHLAAMVAVGLWATQLGKKAVWMVPLSFVLMMFVGAGLANAGVTLPFVEQGIAASVLVLGLLILFSFRMPLAAGMALVSAFALFHGWAHGNEMGEASGLAFGAGFGFSTALLHLAGMGLGTALIAAKQHKVVRLAGALMVVLAGLLVMGVV